MKHHLLKSEEERRALFDEYFSWKDSPEQSIWKEEDLPKLAPFFKYQNAEISNQEFPRDSYEFYNKCWKEYAGKNAALSDDLYNVPEEELILSFGYKRDDDGAFHNNKNLTFPVIAVMNIKSATRGWVCNVDYVELKEFKLKDNSDERELCG